MPGCCFMNIMSSLLGHGVEHWLGTIFTSTQIKEDTLSALSFLHYMHKGILLISMVCFFSQTNKIAIISSEQEFVEKYQVLSDCYIQCLWKP
jgi:hypothetical protein